MLYSLCTLHSSLCTLQVEDDDAVSGAECWLESLVGEGRDSGVVRVLKAMVVGEGEEGRHFAPLWGGKANREALASQLKHR